MNRYHLPVHVSGITDHDPDRGRLKKPGSRNGNGIVMGKNQIMAEKKKNRLLSGSFSYSSNPKQGSGSRSA